MKGSIVALLAVVLLAGAGGAYLLLHSASTSSASVTGTSQSTRSSSSSVSQVGTPAQVAVSYVSCVSSQATCVISLMNSGGTSVEATGCTVNDSSGIISPKPTDLPSQALVNVSCSPSSKSLAIPGFHVTGAIQLSDGSTVQFTGDWR